tara:strand:+ start:79 stop:2787 length:2709 start_codon:yes stop_codon:yes gene_type:complete
MSPLAWPSDYLSANGNGLNIPSLLDDFKASSGLLDLNADENSIFRSTLEALIWSYPLNQTFRLYNLNTRTQAPANSLFKPSFAASWLNESSSPAPNASVLYMPAWIDLRKVDEADHGEQVLQLPKNPDDAYYILAVLDAYINTVGSLGPRTIPKGGSEFPQQILLVGPDSTYYGKSIQEVSIQGTKLPVLQVDTSLAWITARIDTNTLDADAMTATRAFINGTKDDLGSGFQLTSLKDFKETGVVPYSKPISQSSPNQAASRTWGEIPTHAVKFFKQVSEALALNPVPAELETNVTPPPYQIWIGNQNSLQNSDTPYQPPSALTPKDRADLNARFATIGLNLETGFSLPVNWTAQEKVVFQEAYRYGLDLLSEATTALVEGNMDINNGWNISNENIGVYPNTWSSWLVRAGVAVQGGAANIPNDAVYPTTEIDNEGHPLTSTYDYQIVLPAIADQAPPETETYAPAQGFWAFTIYQPNPGNAYQPFLIENAIQNTAYSPINATATLTADGRLRTAKPGNWNRGTAVGTALLTGSANGVNGLDADTIYYVNKAQEVGNELLLSLASDYQPSYASNGIPIGGAGSPTPGSELSLNGAPGSRLSFGWINPVAQLGSSQLAGETNASTTLAIESDGSIALSLSSFKPQSNVRNWLPIPSVTGSGSSNPGNANEFQVMVRYYLPKTDTPSVLAPNNRRRGSPDLYVPPMIQRLGLNRLDTWDLLSEHGEALVKAKEPTFGSTHPFDIPSAFNGDVVGALIDLSILPQALNGQTATVNYSYSRDCAYDNRLFFYVIDDLTGSIDGVAPDDSSYLVKAWENRVHPETPIATSIGSTQKGAIELTTGQLYAPIVHNGEGLIFTAFDNANPGGYRHFDLLSGSSFAFEDQLIGGRTHDRNDGLFTIHSIDL